MGYDVENGTSEDYYIHLSNINDKGKTGFTGGDLTIYGLPTSYNLSRICFSHIPANNLAYTRNGTTLTGHNISYSGATETQICFCCADINHLCNYSA